VLEHRRFKQDRTLRDRQAHDLREETAEPSPGARRHAILQDLRHDWADSPELQPPTMNFVERCFVAMTMAGFIGLIVVLIWMRPT
jgi:hypothetical protein